MKNLKVVSENNIKIDKSRVHALIHALSKSEKFNVSSLQINIINSEYMLKLNKEYLNHDYNTDIITFNYSGSNDNLDGEIFISFQDALVNAQKFNVILDNEIVRLVIHGILHLLGYDDTSASKKRVMKKKENELVESFQKDYRNLIVTYDC